MPRHGPFYQWRRTIAKHLPNLSKPQVSVLALWTWGMVGVAMLGAPRRERDRKALAAAHRMP